VADLHLWIRNAAGKYAGELDVYGTSETIADVQARLAAGLTALDKATNARPPDAVTQAVIDPRITQAKMTWAAAPEATKTPTLVSIAVMLGIVDPV